MNSLSRRRFLTLASATAMGATFFDGPAILSAAGLARKNDPYAGLPMGVQSYSLRNFNTLEVVRHVEGMGLHFVEFYSKHLNPKATDEQIAETNALLKKADIAISAHGVNGFGKDHAANRRTFEPNRKRVDANRQLEDTNLQPDSKPAVHESASRDSNVGAQ